MTPETPHRRPVHRLLWGTLIALNLGVLGLLALRVTAIAGRVEAGMKPAGPAWGATIAGPVETPTLAGERKTLPFVESRFTLAFLVPESGLAQVEMIAAELSRTFTGDELRIVAVMEPGAEPAIATSSTVDFLTVAQDPRGRVRKGLGVSGSTNSPYTLALARDGRVELSIPALVPAEDLRELLERRIFGLEPELFTGDLGVDPPLSLPVREETSEIIGGVERLVVQARRVLDRPAHRMARDEEGRLYLLDRQLHRIDIFGPELEPLRALGGFGQGPGDLMLPVDLALTPGGGLAVIEQGNGRLQVFDRSFRPLDSYRIEPHASSVLASSPGRFWIAGARRGDRISELIVDGGQLSSVQQIVKVPWVSERLSSVVPDAGHRAHLSDTFEYALGRLLLRPGGDDSAFGLSVWKPELVRYDDRGRATSVVTLTSPGIDRAAGQVRDRIERAIDEEKVELSFLFQDFSPIRGGGAILAVTGDCPSLVEVDRTGDIAREICPVDANGRAIAVVSVLAETPTSRLIADGTGVFRIEVPVPASRRSESSEPSEDSTDRSEERRLR